MDPEVQKLIKEAASAWYHSPYRAKPCNDVLGSWKSLINSWIEDVTMPLLIRKSNLPRGHVIEHNTGRELVVTDNTPAHWVMNHALEAHTPTLQKVREALEAGDLGVALAFKPGEKAGATYTGTLKASSKLKPWSICHIEQVNNSSKVHIRDKKIEDLKSHMRKFLSPSNMFVVPRKSHLGEIPEFIEKFREISEIHP